MKIFRWMAVSFSLYSRIPMPRFEWKEEDMAHSLCFFPWVGAVTGALVVGVGLLFYLFGLPFWVSGILALLIPVLITGGFHLDGYMDTKDALSSYAEKEKKLEILKDPHAGSFAVIGIVTRVIFFGLSLCLFMMWGNVRTLIALGILFVNARALSGILALTLPKAKKDGMLVNETKGKNTGDLVFLIIQLVLGIAGTAVADFRLAIPEICFGGFFVLYYKSKMIKEFGGVTGDTAGYFVTVFESDFCILAAILLGVLKFTHLL